MALSGRIVRVRELLEATEANSPLEYLFVEHGPLTLDTLCLVDPADRYDPDSIPVLAQENNLKYVLIMDDYNQIMLNLEDQIDDPSIDQKLQALIYYIQNDAFREWS